VFDLVLIVSVAAVFSAKIHEELGTATPHCSEACVTEALAIAVPALPAVVGLLIQLARTPQAADRLKSLAHSRPQR